MSEKEQVSVSWLRQTTTYMYTSRTKYGFASCWDTWCFFRCEAENGEYVVYATEWIGKDRAHLAYAYLLCLSYMDRFPPSDAPEDDADSEKLTQASLLHEEGKKNLKAWIPPKKSKRNNGGNAATRAEIAPSSSSTLRVARGEGDDDVENEEEEEERDSAPHAVGTLLAPDDPIPETTEDYFGIRCLAHCRGVLLGDSRKSSTFRGVVDGRDLAWRFTDLHGVPKHNPDWPYDELVRAMRNEISAYERLREVQGELIPRFEFCGSDVNFIWVFVTSYEGTSLSELAAKDELTVEIKEAARTSLRGLHARGALHGDVELRNAVWRVFDRRVVWVDLEFSSFRDECEDDDDDSSWFEEGRAEESRRLERVFEVEEEVKSETRAWFARMERQYPKEIHLKNNVPWLKHYRHSSRGGGERTTTSRRTASPSSEREKKRMRISRCCC